MRYTEDDLKIVEGIGPKIEELLKNNGVRTWKDLAGSSIERLREILHIGGERFQMHDPSTWPDQVALALEGKWTELEEYQTLLPGGRLR
jgi:nucleotidyltransferase/DNA polymerase involved in DNA repair